MSSKDTEGNEEKKDGPPPAGLEALTISGETENNDEVKAEGEEDEGDDLFGPLPPKEECALCFVPLPIVAQEMTYQSCCGSTICNGCRWKHKQILAATNAKRALKDPPELPLENNCAFCRAPVMYTNEELIEEVEARMALSDPGAFGLMAGYYRTGMRGLPRDERKSFELYLRAAELGSANACYNVSCMFCDGEGVERDTLKEEHYLKLAARKGHIGARHNLGVVEANRGNLAIAVKHWIISSSAGHDESLKDVRTAYRKKVATKEQFEKAIRANHASKKDIQSEERDKARAARAAGCF